jgi:hypothetical protein
MTEDFVIFFHFSRKTSDYENGCKNQETGKKISSADASFY